MIRVDQIEADLGCICKYEILYLQKRRYVQIRQFCIWGKRNRENGYCNFVAGANKNQYLYKSLLPAHVNFEWRISDGGLIQPMSEADIKLLAQAFMMFAWAFTIILAKRIIIA